MSFSKKQLEPPQKEPAASRIAVVGGGISGLSAAYYALKNGQPGDRLDLYEASDRLGGKLENATIDGVAVNKGGEFIDSTNIRMVSLCKELGVELLPCADQAMQNFQHPDGTLVPGDKFLADYRPLAEQIIRDKQAIAADPEGETAKKLDAMTAEQYLQHLAATVVPEKDTRTYMKWTYDLITFQGHRVDPAVVAMAASAYSSECGQPANKVSALQFAMEASNTPDAFLESDCAYRIAGGSEALVAALRDHLEKKGVSFHNNHSLETLSRAGDGQLNLDFGKEQPSQADKVILALSAYRLGKVKGLEKIGFSAESLQAIAGLQYSKNAKFTIALRPDAKIPNTTDFANSGFQTWSPAPGQLTFLCTAEDMQNKKPAELIAACTEQYAKARGLRAEDVFDRRPGKTVFANPGTAPCYASAAPGQMAKMVKLKSSLDAPGKQGVALAGTYFPMLGINKRQGIGFMECGLNSAMEASMRLCPPTRGAEQELHAQRQLPSGGISRPQSRI